MDDLLALVDDPRHTLRVALGGFVALQVGLLAMHFVVTGLLGAWAAQTADGHIGGFDLDDEATLAVWFSSFQLLLLSIVCRLSSWVAPERLGPRDALLWNYASAVFLVMAVDETAGLHELVGNTFSRLFPQVPMEPSLWWSIPYAIALAPVFLGALLQLREQRGARLLTLCAGLFWLGANLLERHHVASAASVNVALEEGLEMLGGTLLLGAFAHHLIASRRSISVETEPPAERSMSEPARRTAG